MAKLSFNQRYDFIRCTVMGLEFKPRRNADPKGVHLSRDPNASPTFKIRWKGRKPANPGGWRNSTFGLSDAEPRRRKKWVGARDIRESHLKHTRRWRPNPYGEIAVKVPRKLANLEH